MAAIEGRLKATKRHHRGSVFGFSSGCRFEPPVYPGSTRTARSGPELARSGFLRPCLESDTSLAGTVQVLYRLMVIDTPPAVRCAVVPPWKHRQTAGSGTIFSLVVPPNIDFKIGRAIAIRYRYASGVVNEGGAYATRFDRFSAQVVPPSRPKSPEPLCRSRCHWGGGIGRTPIDRPHLVKALQIARTLP